MNTYMSLRAHVCIYTLSEAWSGVNWADLIAAQDAFGTDFFALEGVVGGQMFLVFFAYISSNSRNSLGRRLIAILFRHFLIFS